VTRKSTKKLILSQLTKQPSNLVLDDNDDIIVDDDVTFGRNRQATKFGKLVHDDIEVSDYVRFRLALARALAMEAYEKAHA